MAELLGRLLLREPDERLLHELGDPELAPLLEELGLTPPPADPETVERLAQEYFAAFLDPARGRPLVQSLWEGGAYEGEASGGLRRLAEAAAMDFDPEAARAPVDHLGCILLLWAALREPRPELARMLEEQHLGWAKAPLGQLARREGFHAKLAGVVLDFVEELSVAGGEAG